MQWPLRSHPLPFTVLFSVVLILAGYQNCADVRLTGVKTTTAKSQEETEVSGNGHGYDGKTYVLIDPMSTTCQNQIIAKIIQKDNGQSYLVRESCADIPPRLIEGVSQVSVHPNEPMALSYQGRLFQTEPTHPNAAVTVWICEAPVSDRNNQRSARVRVLSVADSAEYWLEVTIMREQFSVTTSEVFELRNSVRSSAVQQVHYASIGAAESAGLNIEANDMAPGTLKLERFPWLASGEVELFTLSSCVGSEVLSAGANSY